MDEVYARLVRCFSGVFPETAENDIPNASLTSVEAWDSLATITLLTVVEEEFRVQFEPDNLEHLVSFTAILEYLRSQNLLDRLAHCGKRQNGTD